MADPPAEADKKGTCFMVHDPFAEVLCGRARLSEAARDADRIGCSLMIEVDASDIRSAADAVGIRGLLVHVLADEARRFYFDLGLEPPPLDPLVLMVTLADLR